MIEQSEVNLDTIVAFTRVAAAVAAQFSKVAAS
jgi:hypothetical protein